MKNYSKHLLLVTLIGLMFHVANADSISCDPSVNDGWVVKITKTDGSVVRPGQEGKSYAFIQDCVKAISLYDDTSVTCAPFEKGSALYNSSGELISPDSPKAHSFRNPNPTVGRHNNSVGVDVEACVGAIKNIKANIICISVGNDLYTMVDLADNNSVVVENSTFSSLTDCNLAVATASEAIVSKTSSLICSHVNGVGGYGYFYRHGYPAGERFKKVNHKLISDCAEALEVIKNQSENNPKPK
jgi:hypothetical protein